MYFRGQLASLHIFDSDFEVRQEHNMSSLLLEKSSTSLDLFLSSLLYLKTSHLSTLKLLNLPCEQALQPRPPLLALCSCTSYSPGRTYRPKLSTWEMKNLHFTGKSICWARPHEGCKLSGFSEGAPSLGVVTSFSFRLACRQPAGFLSSVSIWYGVDKQYFPPWHILRLKIHFKWWMALFYFKHHHFEKRFVMIHS